MEATLSTMLSRPSSPKSWCSFRPGLHEMVLACRLPDHDRRRHGALLRPAKASSIPVDNKKVERSFSAGGMPNVSEIGYRFCKLAPQSIRTFSDPSQDGYLNDIIPAR